MSRPKSVATPTLAQLRSFVAVNDAGGFGEAAAELGVSQSSLSEAVAKLEGVVGRSLLRRGPSGVKLTPVGERVLGYARVSLQAAGDVMLAAQSDRLTGVLRVASFRSTATHLLPPVLADFRQSHPGVVVRLEEADVIGGAERLIRSGAVDLGMVIDDDPELLDLHLTPLVTDEYLFIAPASRGAHQVTPDELNGCPLILPPKHNCCYYRTHRYFSSHSLDLNVIEEASDDSVILSLVAHGLGFTVMPKLAATPLPDSLLALSLPDPMWRPLALASLPHRAGLPLLQAFTSAMVECFTRVRA